MISFSLSVCLSVLAIGTHLGARCGHEYEYEYGYGYWEVVGRMGGV